MNDKKNAVKKLQSCVKSIKYTKLDLTEVNIGSPREYLKLYHYLFMDYSPLLAAEIVNKHQLELSMKNDKSFMDGVYKLTRDMFEYVPKLSRDQFFTTNYAQVKALMAADIIQLILVKVKALQSSNTFTASSSSTVVSSFNHVNPAASNGAVVTQLPTVMPNTCQSTGSNVVKAVKATNEDLSSNQHAPKLAAQGPKSTRSQVHLHSQQPTGSSLARSASVNYGSSHAFPFQHKETNNTLASHTSRQPTRNQNEDFHQTDEAVRPKDDTADSLLATHVSEISTNLNLLLSRMENFEKFVQSHQQSDDLDNRNATVIQNGEGVEELKNMVKADRKEQENLGKRVTLLENEILVLKHQNKMLNAQLNQQQALIQQLMQFKTPSRSTVNRHTSQEYYSDEDNRDESDQTAFETPLHSFFTANDDDETAPIRRPNSRKASSSTTSSQSSMADYVQIPTIGSTTTPSGLRTGSLLSQGILHDAASLSEGVDDLSLSSNQITDPNDLTPTIDGSSTAPSKLSGGSRHQFASNREESPLSNDAIVRARQLVDRASQLKEQTQAKK